MNNTTCCHHELELLVDQNKIHHCQSKEVDDRSLLLEDEDDPKTIHQLPLELLELDRDQNRIRHCQSKEVDGRSLLEDEDDTKKTTEASTLERLVNVALGRNYYYQ